MKCRGRQFNILNLSKKICEVSSFFFRSTRRFYLSPGNVRTLNFNVNSFGLYIIATIQSLHWWPSSDLDYYSFFFSQPCLCGFNTLFLRTRHNSCSIVGRIGISLNERVSSDIYSDGGHNLINKAGPSRHFNATPGIGSDNGS